nr:ketopantoate hydroxymethyltransferase [Cohnella thailandensis]
MNDIATYVNGRVAKVVINGSYEITDFVVKQVTESTMALNYIVPVSDVQLITQIELKDSGGKMLTSSPVNIPVSSDILMLQSIIVKEATT